MWTVLRGPFVHKQSQENVERRVHKWVIKAWEAHPVIMEKVSAPPAEAPDARRWFQSYHAGEGALGCWSSDI